MGLDATVRCRCWEERKIRSAPPHEEHVILDEEGRLKLNLPWQENEEKHRAFDQWLEHCCAHPKMEYADEWISNWGGLRKFQSKLLEFGIEQFPILADVLPNANGGLVSPDQSGLALAELDSFARRDFGSRVVLVDADTGDEVGEYIPVYNGWFISAPGNWQGGVDPNGFFVRGPKGLKALLALLSKRLGRPRRKTIRTIGEYAVTTESADPYSRLLRWLARIAQHGPTRERFRSMNFRQEKVGEHAFRFTDLRSGRSFIAPFGASRHAPWPDGRMQNDEGRLNCMYPNHLTVEHRRASATEFDYILRPLRTVFRASVETGNPVRWL